MNSKKFMHLLDTVSSTVRRHNHQPRHYPQFRHCALDAQSRVSNLERQTKSVFSLTQKGKVIADAAYQWSDALNAKVITSKNKKTASPPRLFYATYQPLCLKRRMNKAQWRGLFLSFTHTNRLHISTLDTVSSTVRRRNNQTHHRTQTRHCRLDLQSRVDMWIGRYERRKNDEQYIFRNLQLFLALRNEKVFCSSQNKIFDKSL